MIVVCMGAMSHAAASTRKIVVSNAADLERVLERRLGDVDIRLMAGRYDLTPSQAVDSTCGNCEDPRVAVDMTAGLRISGSRVRIFGAGRDSTVIYTHAGYGLFFEDCEECVVADLSITGGERDPDGRATDAAIVAARSSVRIERTRVHDNIGDSLAVAANVVGIMGICGREGSRLHIEDNEILRNSWDGIALYRGSEARIVRNTIDGVDRATGSRVGGGRGVAVGVTWNAVAHIEENLVRRYWKGIGLFVDARGVVERNVVEDIVTWGIALWDADKGRPSGRIVGNVIYDTGACGASITCARSAGSDVVFGENIIVHTAQNPKYDDPEYYCYQCALALHAVPEGASIRDNVFFDNRRAAEDLPDDDVAEAEFRRSIGLERYRAIRESGVFRGSDFRNRFWR